MEEAHEVDTNMTLADAMEEVGKHEYVLIRGKDKKITGIVTATDLADQFKKRAHPFLLIGEIELRLRNIVRGKFSVGKFAEASDGNKEARGPDDLTLGDYCRLLGNEESWNELNLPVDRKEFIRHLDSVRSIRNDIMHFSADEHDPEDIELLECVARLLRNLRPADVSCGK